MARKPAPVRRSAAALDPSTPSLAVKTMAPRWRLMSDTLGGTETMRANAAEYLPQHQGEADKRYQERCKTALFTNYVRLTSEFLIGKPFSKPVVFTKDTVDEIKALEDDLDLCGNDLTTVLKDWFTKGFEKNVAYCLVEFPEAPSKEDGAPVTKEEQERLSLRPYWVILPAEAVISAVPARINGEEQFIHLRYWDCEVVQDGYEEKIVERIREWNAIPTPEGGTQVQVITHVKYGKNWITSGPVRHPTIDRVPLVKFETNNEGRPELLDLAYINVTHFQSESDQRASLTVARFPILAGSGVDEEKSIVLGPYQFLASSDVQSKYYYVEHTGSALEAGSSDLTALEDKMALYGAEMLKERPDRQTATSAILDNAQTTSPLQRIVFMFKSAVEQALYYTKLWLELDEEAEARIEINTEFALTKEQGQKIDNLKELRKMGEISRKQFLEGLKEAGALSPNFNIDDNTKELKAEAQEKVNMETEAALKIAAARPQPAGPPAK